MKLTQYSLYFILVLLLTGLVSGINPASAQKTGLTLQVVTTFGKEKLQLNKMYTTLSGDKVSITRCKFYLSNITLTHENGSVWKQKDSYHLVEVLEDAEPVLKIDLLEVPPGKYTQLSFAVGVDSLNNHSGEQSGMLDPDYGMFWMWETGYIFLKCEGFYHQPDGGKGPIVYHVGRDQCYRQVHLMMHSALQLAPKTAHQLTIQADIARIFGGFPEAGADIKMPADQTSVSVMGGNIAPKIADNYQAMFSILP